MKRILLVFVCIVIFVIVSAQNTPILRINKCATPPKIDGIADSYDPWTATWIPLSNASIFNTTSAMSAKFQLTFDNNNLYLIARITDATLGIDTNYEWWALDHIRVFLKMDTTSSDGTYITGDYEFSQRRSSVFPKDFIVESVGQIPLNGNKNIFINDTNFKIKQTDNGFLYTQEWQIPWVDLESGMDLSKLNDSFIKFNIVACDNTGFGWTQSQIWYTNSLDEYINTNYLGLVQLLKPVSIEGGNKKNIVCGEKLQLSVLTNFTNPGTISYSWSPSDGLNQDTISNPIVDTKTSRTYYLTVTTSNCGTIKDSVMVNEIPLTVNTGADKSLVCGSKLQLDKPITNYTGSGTLNYNWTPTDGLSETNVAQPLVDIITNRTYTLSISTSNECTAKDSVIITVNPLIASAGNVTVSCGNTAQLYVQTNYTGNGELMYNWLPSDNLNSANIANPIATLIRPTIYSVKVSTPNGCIAQTNASVNLSTTNYQPSICMVSVGENNKNIVVWQKEFSTAIDSFLIYRESLTQTNQFDFIGYMSSSAQSVFIDSFSNAMIQSNRYKIAAKDACGFITNQSSVHKTMHLNINKGQANTWNLIWEAYEGFDIDSYKIYRGTALSNLTLIGSTAGGSNSYSDLFAPDGDVFYQIEVIAPYSCSTLKSSSYSSSLSNIASNTFVSVSTVNAKNNLSIYPVPANEILYLNNSSSFNYDVNIFSMDGRIMLSIKQPAWENKINVNSLSHGMYVIKINYNNESYYQKFIKN
jgi:hypothetical protein